MTKTTNDGNSTVITINDDIVAEMEQKYPEMTTEFKRIQYEQYRLFCRKQKNYGSNNISLGSSLEHASDIKFSLQGLWFRMNDKLMRYKEMIFFGSQDVVGESLQDTFQDISVYGIITQLVANKKWGK